MNNRLHVFFEGDINNIDSRFIISNCEFVGIDTETTGLDPLIDDLCIIQISANGSVYIIRYDNNIVPINLINILLEDKVCKVFHHANFDIRFLIKNLNIPKINNIVCTKIAAKLISGTSISSSLKFLLEEYLNISIDKGQQRSDWSKAHLSNEQIEYALTDVKYLVDLWFNLEEKLQAKGLLDLAMECYQFLPTFSYLQNNGIESIFTY